MGATRNTGYLENLIQYDASDNVAIATSVNPSYKVTLGGSMLGTSAVFSSTITSSNEFRGLNGYGIRSYTAATATGNNILFAASVFASFDGIYQSSGSTNDFGIWTNGGTINQPKFVIKNGGNVGIGTTSPNKGGVNRALTLNAATSTNASYELSVNDILQGSLYTTISDTSVRLANFNSGDIVFVTGASSTERMRITSAGDMYLTGRSTNGDYGMYFYSNDTDSRIYSSNSGAVSKSLIFYTSGTERLRIRSGGEVSFIPTTWTYVNPNTTYRNMDIGAAGFLYRDATDAYLLSNHYYNSSGQNIAKYTYSEGIGAFAFAGGNLTWYSYGASVTAGSSYATTPRFTVTYDGKVGVGLTSPQAALHVTGAGGIRFSSGAQYTSIGSDGIYCSTSNMYIDAGAYDLRFWAGSTERMRITSGGNVLLSSDKVLGINTSDGSDNGYLALCGASADGDTRGARIYLSGNERTVDAGNIVIAAGNSTSGTGAPGTIVFRTGADTERMRITSGGYLKVSNNNTHSTTGNYHDLRNSTTGSDILYMVHSAASPYGIEMRFSGASPNNTGNWFFWGEDSTALRIRLNSDGGLANYQANNQNLSDIRTKKDIISLESYWDKFKALEIVKFKYNDQTHDDYNIGVIAQQVESVAPEFVDVDGWGETPEDGVPLKSIYTADLYHATIKVLQEAMIKIEEQQAQIEELKSKLA